MTLPSLNNAIRRLETKLNAVEREARRFSDATFRQQQRITDRLHKLYDLREEYETKKD